MDYKIIQSSCKKFRYSDLITVINAIYTKTGKESILYQLKKLVGNKGEHKSAIKKALEEEYVIFW